MKKEYLTCAICKKKITLKPAISIDTLEKEWWEEDSKTYWKNRDSGKIFCDKCINKIFWEPECCGQEV